MSGFLLDTNCISEAVSVKPNARVLAWLDSVDERDLYLSVLTLGEIRKGIVALMEGRRRMALEAWLETDLRRRFAGRILPVDDLVADRWGTLAADMNQHGIPMPIVDGLLAATAARHGLTIVTRNIRDFRRAAVAIFNPWEEG